MGSEWRIELLKQIFAFSITNETNMPISKLDLYITDEDLHAKLNQLASEKYIELTTNRIPQH